MQSKYACDTEVVPLYRQPQPTLTDAEREAVEVCAKLVRNVNRAGRVFGCESQEDAEIELTLRGLLERLA